MSANIYGTINITIANGFILNWAMLVQKLLKLKKSLNYVSVKSEQDQCFSTKRPDTNL